MRPSWRGSSDVPAAREAIEVHQAAGRASRPAACELRSRAAALAARRPSCSCTASRQLVPLPQADPGARRAGAAGVAFDFPGLGLADRPEDFDYTWSGLARWIGEALDALEHRPLPPRRPRHRRADRVRVGGREPRAGPLADRAQHDARPRRLQPPVVDAAVRDPRGRRALASRTLARWPCLGSSTAGRRRPRRDRLAAEVYAYHDLLRRDDGGRAFLRIMRGFELTEEKQRRSGRGSRERPYPARIVWGERDPALGLDQLRLAQEALGVERPDPAAGQALPAGGPGDPGRQRDRRPGGAARLRRPSPRAQAAALAARAPFSISRRLPALGKRDLHDVEVARRHRRPGTPRAPRRAPRARRSARRRGPARASSRRPPRRARRPAGRSSARSRRRARPPRRRSSPSCTSSSASCAASAGHLTGRRIAGDHDLAAARAPRPSPGRARPCRLSPGPLAAPEGGRSPARRDAEPGGGVGSNRPGRSSSTSAYP